MKTILLLFFNIKNNKIECCDFFMWILMLKNTRKEPWEVKGANFNSTDNYFAISRPYNIWYELLRLSPSFALAHKLLDTTTKERGLTAKEKSLCPTDFDLVLQTYKDFELSSVLNYKTFFSHWWLRVGIDLFGQKRVEPAIVSLLNIKQGQATNEIELKKAFDEYLAEQYQIDGMPGFMLLVVPMTGKKSELMKRIGHSIHPEDIKPIAKPGKGLYSLFGQRTYTDSLTKRLRVLWMRAYEPELNSVQLGFKARVGKANTYKELEEIYLIEPESKWSAEIYDDSRALTASTSRALSDALYLMENAARGKFPCYDEVELPKINYRKFQSIMKTRIEKETILVQKLERIDEIVHNGITYKNLTRFEFNRLTKET